MKKLTHNEFVDRLNSLNPFVEIQTEYINQRTKITVKGKECGHVWDARPYDLLKGHYCPKCRYVNNGKKSRCTNDVFLENLKAINPYIEPLEAYVTSQMPIKVRCCVCHYVWTVKPNTLLNGSGCSNCAGLRKKTTDEFIYALQKTNSSIEVTGTYTGNRNRIDVKCKKCGYIWNPTAKSLLNGHGCPECIKTGTSFMEQFILCAFKKILGNEAVINRDRKTLGVELDIFIPSKSLAFEPGSWFWHKKLLKKDEEKRLKGKKNGIRVITIYDTFPTGEKNPFDEDCFTFDGQLNEPGYIRLKGLVKELLLTANISFVPTENFWNQVIDEAHKNVSRITHNEFLNLISVVSPSIEAIETYKSNSEKLKVKCRVCNYSWKATPSALLKGARCVACLGVKHLTTEEFTDKLSRISPFLEVRENYVNTNTKIEVKSTLCNHIWSATPNSLLGGSGCPICANNKRKSTSQFTNEVKTINPEITILGEYVNSHTKILAKCNNCQNEFLITPNSLLNGHGCKNCNLIRGILKRKNKASKT